MPWDKDVLKPVRSKVWLTTLVGTVLFPQALAQMNGSIDPLWKETACLGTPHCIQFKRTKGVEALLPRKNVQSRKWNLTAGHVENGIEVYVANGLPRIVLLLEPGTIPGQFI